MNFIKGNIGSGILSMPVVLRYAGLWVSFARKLTWSSTPTKLDWARYDLIRWDFGYLPDACPSSSG